MRCARKWQARHRDNISFHLESCLVCSLEPVCAHIHNRQKRECNSKWNREVMVGGEWSVTARRNEGDKMLQSHTGLCSQSITPKDIEKQPLLSIHLHSYLYFPLVHLILSFLVNTRLHPYLLALKKKSILSLYHPSSLNCLYSITGCVHNAMLQTCASITLMPFSFDESQRAAVLTNPYTWMANASWGAEEGDQTDSTQELWIDGASRIQMMRGNREEG